jgi:alkylated DNA repair dioxygenase AlkB
LSTLFPLDPLFIPGFSYEESFITKEEELQLLETISQVELHTFIFQGYEAKRKVASFGFDYSFEKKALSKGKPIPKEFDWLVERVASKFSIPLNEIAELLVIEYPPGAVVNWHRDAPPFDVIAGISLKTDCTFKFRPHDKSKQGRGSVRSYPLKRRSVYLMKDEVRSEWEHSTAPVKETRYSITVRTLKNIEQGTRNKE